MTKNKNNYKFTIIIAVLTGIFFIIAIFVKTRSIPRIPPAGPTAQDEIQLKKRTESCPYLISNIPNKGQYYSVVSYECSFRDPSIKEGEELVVETPKDKELKGKKEFEEFLESQNLQISSRLRVTFQIQ